MMTWFDVLLITLLALVTALGVQRGLVGLLWGVGAALICLACNLLSGVGAVALALVLGGALAYGTQALLSQRSDPPLWESLLGGVGGLLFGLVFVASLTLSFPLQGAGHRLGYPSSQAMPPALYRAIRDSAVQTQLRGVWHAQPLLRRWLIPDQLGKRSAL